MSRWAALAATLLLAPPASAQPVIDAARNYVRSGVEAFEAGRFVEAARAFREAHAISHRAELLFNVGRAEAAGGNLQAAIDALSLFRSAGAPGFDRAALDEQIERLQAQLAEQQRLAAEARAQNAPPPTPPTVRSVIEPRWFRVEYQHSTLNLVGPWVTVGLGAAVGVAGIVQGAIASSEVSLLRDVNAGSTPWSQSAQDAQNGASGAVTRAAVLGAVGGTMVLGGVLWFLLRGPGTRREVRSAPVLSVTPSGFALGIGGTL